MFLSFQFGLLIFAFVVRPFHRLWFSPIRGCPTSATTPICYRLSAISFEPQARMTARMRASPSLVRKELAAHGDLDPITFRILHFVNLHSKIDCAHNAIPELLMDQFLDRLPINQSDFVKSID